MSFDLRRTALVATSAVLILGVTAGPALAPSTKDRRDIIINTTAVRAWEGSSALIAGVELGVDAPGFELVSRPTREATSGGAFVARADAYSVDGAPVAAISVHMGARVATIPFLSETSVTQRSEIPEGRATVVSDPTEGHQRNYRAYVRGPFGLFVEKHVARAQVSVAASEGFTVSEAVEQRSPSVLELVYTISHGRAPIAQLSAVITTTTTADSGYTTGPIIVDDDDD